MQQSIVKRGSESKERSIQNNMTQSKIVAKKLFYMKEVLESKVIG